MTSDSKLSKSFEYIGVSTSLETFSQRKKLQKLTYLVQELASVSLGFEFNWYLHGPYSPQLTRTLYNGVLQSPEKSVVLTEEERKKLDALKDFLEKDIHSSDTLELIASLHYIMKIGRETGKSDQDIIDLFMKLKPFFGEELVKYYFNRLKNRNQIR